MRFGDLKQHYLTKDDTDSGFTHHYVYYVVQSGFVIKVQDEDQWLFVEQISTHVDDMGSIIAINVADREDAIKFPLSDETNIPICAYVQVA